MWAASLLPQKCPKRILWRSKLEFVYVNPGGLMREELPKEIDRVSSFKARKRGIKESRRTIVGRLSPRKPLSTFLVIGFFVLCGGLHMCPLVSAQGKPKPTVSLITLTPDGFQPKEIVRAHGNFLLAVDNRSGITDDALVFWMSVLRGPRLSEVRLPRGRPGWRL